MSFQIHNIIGKAAFKVWELIAPSLTARSQDFDKRMLLENEMCPEFPWKKYEKKKNPYFKKWGFNVSQMVSEYYSRVSGIKADHYVTRAMAKLYIYPYLDRYDFVPAYMDKNTQKALLRLPEDGFDVLMPDDVIYNSNGVFFRQNQKECTREEALDILTSYEEDLILKPSVDSFGGHGVMKVAAHSSRTEFETLFDKYRYNFTFQKMVKQHPVMAQFNPTSVNTIRVVTYRDFQNQRKVLYACLRFGGSDSVMDNVCSGGGFTGVNIVSGELTDRKRYSYYIMDIPSVPESFPNQIPCWDKIKKAALDLHERLPQLDIVGWDLALSPEGIPVLLEFNPRPGVGLQQAVGPMFSKEDLDEIMSHVSKVKSGYHPYSVLKYKDFPERRTIHTKFGAR